MFAVLPTSVPPSYCFQEAVKDSIALEAASGHLDIGPVDTLDTETLKREYDAFYGASPLNSPTPSPSPSRPTSPDAEAQERCHDRDYGTSPLSTPPQSPLPSRPATPVSVRELLPLSTAPPSPQKAQPNSKNRRNRRKGAEKRRTKRKAERDGQDKNAKPYLRSVKRIKRADSTQTSYDTNDVPSASTGFIAHPDTEPGRIVGLEALLQDPFFKLIKHQEGKPQVIVDKDGRVVAVAVGHPDDQSWEAVQQSGHKALLSAAKRIKFPKKALRHRWGKFPALSTGISHGGGRTQPGNLYHEDGNAKELDALTRHPSFYRIAGFASSAFHTWVLKLHTHYAENLDALLDKHPGLRRNFSNSVFAAAAFNFGPRTCSKSHRDHANLPYGWCSVTALGSYDYTRGGHLVLWELGLVIEFPPGSTILLPSAAISHSNTPIAPHETRTSFAQFTAGGLFRWVAHDFQTDEKFFRGKTQEELALIAAENEARCKVGLSLFSTFKEVEAELRLRGAK